MATPTAPTVVLPPQQAADARAAAPSGPLASILAPVEPARPVRPIGSTVSMAEEPAGATSGEKPAKQTGRGSGEGREHPVGALVRAIAARIGRTGTTNTIKRQHTITESRVSGTSVNTSNANRSNRDAKHHRIGQHRTTRDAKLADLNNKVRQQHGRDQRDVKAHDTRASTQSGSSRNGRDVKDHTAKQRSDASTAKKDVLHATARDGLGGKPGRGGVAKTSGPAAPAKGKDTAGAAAKGKDQAAPKPAAPAKDAPASKDTKAKAGADSKRPPAKASAAAKTPTPALRPRTQPSREAGYRDGTRAATVVGHVKAYRDGVQDGYADRAAVNEAEKKRMDDAKARNARQPAAPDRPAMDPASGSTVDLAKKDTAATPAPAGPAPVQVTGVSDAAVSFDAAGVSHTLSRGEVRTLKAFERRMAAKAPVMQRVAEDSKTTRAKAVEHANRAQKLAEQAKDVEGGERLVARLQALAEKSRVLRAKTEEIEKAALRGAEAVRVLVANANTRHGGIYRAVADSPLTKPAEREFYQDKEGS